MNVHKNARMTRFGRLQLVHRIRQEGWTVAQAAEASSVSVRTAYKSVGPLPGGRRAGPV